MLRNHGDNASPSSFQPKTNFAQIQAETGGSHTLRCLNELIQHLKVLQSVPFDFFNLPCTEEIKIQRHQEHLSILQNNNPFYAACSSKDQKKVTKNQYIPITWLK